MKVIVFTLLTTLFLAAGIALAAQHDHHENMPGMAMMADCPMRVTGAEFAVSDTSDGVAVTATTKSGDVAELRRTTEKMASIHAQAVDSQVPFKMKYEAIENGARITLTPVQAADLAQLREKTRKHVAMMAKGECPMMQGMHEHH